MVTHGMKAFFPEIANEILLKSTNFGNISHMDKIKLITFDADDTLWNFTAMIMRGLTAVCDDIQTQFPTYTITPQQLQDKAIALFKDVGWTTANFTDLRERTFALALKEAHAPDTTYSRELLSIYHQVRDERYDLFPDVQTVLEGLQGRYHIGWITNGHSRPEHVGLEAFFDFTITELTLDLRKPDARVFQYAAEQVNCQTHEILHIGDNLETDVMGVQGVGGTGIWYNFHRRENPGKVQPDAEIYQLAEVLTLLP